MVELGTRHRVLVVTPTVVVVASVVGGTPGRVVGGATATILVEPGGPTGPCRPWMPVGPGPLKVVGPVVGLGPGRGGVDGGEVLTAGSVVEGAGGRVAVAITVEATALATSRPAPTHHSRAVDRACRARTIPIRRLALIVPGGPAPAAPPWPAPHSHRGWW